MITDEGAILRTPLDVRVKGVQLGSVEVVVEGTASQIALPSIFKSSRPSNWSSIVAQQW